jgi:predicted aspartyl protease
MLSHRGVIEDFGLPVPVIVRGAREQITVDGFGGLEFQVLGVIDTGATRSAISARVVEDLGFVRGRRETLLTAGGPYVSPLYEVDLFVILAGAHGATPVAEMAGSSVVVGEDASNSGDYDVLIGLDVLRHFTLTVSGPRGRFRLARP